MRNDELRSGLGLLSMMGAVACAVKVARLGGQAQRAAQATVSVYAHEQWAWLAGFALLTLAALYLTHPKEDQC